MPSITVGIAGITGKFGRLLALSLREASPQVKLRGLARDPSKVDNSSLPNVELFQGDAFDVDKIHSFVRGTDVVVCCYLGDTRLMIEGQKVLIDIAEEEGVPRYVASDWSLDWTKLEMGELFAKEPCQRIHEYLTTKKSIRGVHVLIGGFTDVIFAPFFKIWDQEKLTFNYWGTGDEVWECTSYLNSAQYTAAVCLDPEAMGVLRFVGDVISIKDMARTFERVYGKNPPLHLNGSLEELRTTTVRDRQKYGEEFYKYVF
ncbi:uncharacterized protein A1O9_10869 [Exophiala aquamarina CBS 119918]|uniref:NAD(P)-binding domain-containing protein n=1 Tax=Exophiala aquamarina CBS 119918 TaxID=1182545 RepID=A0A072P108_9EURO|nr:uncharacterized protein A1O9_10869 [Exophiala aquamarina CBS 119918]KEF52963.1 hypothetical protein A1O9_10869 [Exophiala aquamarina CBS 119918]